MSCNIRQEYVNPTSHAGLKQRGGNCYPSIKANKVTTTKKDAEECRRNYMKLLMKQVCGLSCVTILRFHPNMILGALSATSGMPSSPITLERRQTPLHPDLSNSQQNNRGPYRAPTHPVRPAPPAGRARYRPVC